MIRIKTLPISYQQSAIVIFICLLAIVAYLFDGQLSNILIYQRSLIAQGQIWRLFTGHLFHTNGYHLLLNLAAIILLWSLHGRFYNLKNYSALLLITALITSMGLYICSPDLERYVGLSGILHGVFTWGAIMDIKHKDKTGYLLFIGVWLKILHEQIFGPSEDVVSLIEANVAVDAHLWGAIGGLVTYFVYLMILRNQGINNNQ